MQGKTPLVSSGIVNYKDCANWRYERPASQASGWELSALEENEAIYCEKERKRERH